MPAADGATGCVCGSEDDKREAGGTADFPPGPQKEEKQGDAKQARRAAGKGREEKVEQEKRRDSRD